MRGATEMLQPVKNALIFLLTRPMRGATQEPDIARKNEAFLLTRPMRGATSAWNENTAMAADFYSHAPCGARQPGRHRRIPAGKFLLTRPMRGAT